MNPTNRDVLQALIVGCRQGHEESIERARLVIEAIAESPPEILADFLESMVDEVEGTVSDDSEGS